MNFTLIPISERLPNSDSFKHPLDTIIFYDTNGVKFLFGKKHVLKLSRDEWQSIGFVFWLEEKDISYIFRE